MKAFLDFLSSIPKELWTPIGTLAAGIFTAVVAFTAVMLQNSAAARRHRRELEHDANQRSLERASELRKIVYLDALDSLSRMTSLITDMWNVNISETALNESLGAEVKTATGRLYAIAGIETIRALDDVNRAALELVQAILPIRLSFGGVRQLQDRVKSFFERAATQRDEVVAALSDKELSDEKRAALEAERARLQAVVEKSATKFLELQRGSVNSSLDVQMLGIEKARKFHRAVWRVTLAIREELGFPIDQKVFGDVMEAFLESSLETLRSVAKTMEADMEKTSKKLTKTMEKPQLPAAT